MAHLLSKQEIRLRFQDFSSIVFSYPLTQQKQPMEPTAFTVTSAYRCLSLFSRLTTVSNGGVKKPFGTYSVPKILSTVNGMFQRKLRGFFRCGRFTIFHTLFFKALLCYNYYLNGKCSF